MTKGHQHTEAPAPAGRRLIDRPRLLKQLDETDARIILLVAPAGYGKTTLARQWTRDRRAAWYRATPASADVAVTAAGVAEAASPFIEGFAEMLGARIVASRNPEIEAATLGEVAAQQLENWPSDAWLILDDAHLVGSEAASAFMTALIEHSPIRLLATSRRRPPWLPVRKTVYGEVFELEQNEFAFTLDESKSVLARAPNMQVIVDIHDRAQGWPAVIGLAGASPTLRLPEDGRPSALYEYFADELLLAADPSIARRLEDLSIVPSLRPEVIDALVPDAADLLEDATRSGFLTRDAAAVYTFHPLLRSFFHAKLVTDADHTERAERTARVLLNLELWEDAFDVIRLFRLDDFIPALFEGLHDMLGRGQLATVELWITYSADVGRHSPLVDLAEAEVAKRQGRFRSAETLALQAARLLAGTPFLARAYAVAGECRYYDGQSFQQSLDYLRKAEALAETLEDEYRALWGQVLCAGEIKAPPSDFISLVDRLDAKRAGDPNLEMRVAAARTIAATFDGHVADAAADADLLMGVASRATDPLATTFYLYEVAYLSVLATRYDRAAEVARIAIGEAERLRLDFVRVHVLTVGAFSQIGARHFRRAELAIKVAADAANAIQDQFGKVNIRALSARLALARRRPEIALAALDIPLLARVHPSLRGECRSLQALANVIAGDSRTALRLAASAEEETSEVQTRCYAALTRAMARRSRATVTAALETLAETQAFDCLVCAYRASPQFLRVVAGQAPPFDLPAIVRHARDYKLAAEAGIAISDVEGASAFDLLTKREREVLGLICEGLTNAEIAERLYLSLATVKLHLRHIYAKLGVRSRTEAVLLTNRERDQL